MKRNMDLARQILIDIEEGKKAFDVSSSEKRGMLGLPLEGGPSASDADTLAGHLDLLEDGGFIEIQARLLGGAYMVKGLSWKGHDFLDSVRDPEIWEKTKSGALQAGGWTFDLVKDLAKGYAKKKIEDMTGVQL